MSSQNAPTVTDLFTMSVIERCRKECSVAITTQVMQFERRELGHRTNVWQILIFLFRSISFTYKNIDDKIKDGKTVEDGKIRDYTSKKRPLSNNDSNLLAAEKIISFVKIETNVESSCTIIFNKVEQANNNIELIVPPKVYSHDTNKRAFDSEPPKDIQGPFHQPFPETVALITKNSATVKIPDTNVVLKIPSGALPENMDECEIKMRILPRNFFKDPALTFSSNSSVVVEILPNNLYLKHAAQLLVPHCLFFKKGKTPKAKIYMSHHDEGSTASWVEHSDLHYCVEDTYCVVWLHKFCWVTIKVDDEDVLAKNLILYTCAKRLQPWDQYAEITVGYYPELDGEERFLKLYENTSVQKKISFVFMKEGSHPLCLSLYKFPSEHWTVYDPEDKKMEIAFKDISASIARESPFILEKIDANAGSPMCIFIACQHKGQKDVKFAICPQLCHPPSSHLAVGHGSSGSHFQPPKNCQDVVTIEAIQFLSKEIGTEWLYVGTDLEIQKGTLEQIRQDNISSTRNAIHEMLLHWKQSNGSKATYQILKRSLEKAGRTDLAEKVQNQ